MHPNTLAALQALAVTLAEHPEDAAELMTYGHLTEQLADALDDACGACIVTHEFDTP